MVRVGGERSPERLLLGALAAIALVAATCGSSPTAGSTQAGSVTASAPYASKGPYAVGYTTLALSGGRRVVVWYPADRSSAGGHPQETVDLTGMLSPALQAKVPSADRVLYPADANWDAPPISKGAPFPLVLFSHGYAGFPEQSVTLTTHLASWGFVVAAPDHVERSLDGLLGTASEGVPAMSDSAVLEATQALVEEASSASGMLHGLVNTGEVAVIGHSAGATAAYETASADPAIRSWISYSVALGPDSGVAHPPPPVPDKPGMVMLGTADGIIPPSTSRAVFAGMRSPKYLVEIGGAGHLVFSDICLIGRSKGGVVGIARELQLPIPPSLLKLGSDGCYPPHPPVTTAFPAIDQLSTAFLRYSLGVDRQPIGLTTAAVAGLGGRITVLRR